MEAVSAASLEPGSSGVIFPTLIASSSEQSTGALSSSLLSFLGESESSEDCVADCDANETSCSLPSAVVVATALTVQTTLLRRDLYVLRSRAHGYTSSLFSNPFSFDDIAEFYGPEMFRQTFRMSRSCFDQLLGSVVDLLERQYKGPTDYRRETIPADIRLAITLRLLAGASYCDLCVAYQVKKTTIYEIFQSTVDALMERLLLKGLPGTQLALQNIANGFQTSRPERSPLCGCVGALDGICIKIRKPSARENPATFYSRKGFYALPVQALCDSNYIFRYCSAVCTGATHDSLAFAVSGLKKDIDDGILGMFFYIVGDEAYVCTEYVITPFPNDVADADQDNFNFFLSSLRIHIEQAFGMLVARWRILQSALQFSVPRCADIVCLLMKLHNFCIEHDNDASSFVDGLTSEEKEQLEEEVNQRLGVSDEVAEEFRDRSQTRVATRYRTRQNNAGRTKRDKLVALVKEKNRRRPAPAPLTTGYEVGIDTRS